MTDETTDLVLEHLKRIQAKLGTIEVDFADVKVRVSTMEQHQGQMLIRLGGLNQRMDRFESALGG
jgi:hypothetical protein